MDRLLRCQHCGFPMSECTDPERLWYPQRDICYASAELAAANRTYDALHEAEPWHDGTFKAWSAKRSREFPYHYRDGVTIRVAQTDERPGDKFLSPPTLDDEGDERSSGGQ